MEETMPNNENQDEQDLIDALAEIIAEGEEGVFLTDFQRLHGVNLAYKAMRHIVRGVDVKISYEINEPYVSMGSVSIVGKDITITDTNVFAAAAKLADNIEVYPKVDGTTQINLTFHRLARKVGD